MSWRMRIAKGGKSIGEVMGRVDLKCNFCGFL